MSYPLHHTGRRNSRPPNPHTRAGIAYQQLCPTPWRRFHKSEKDAAKSTQIQAYHGSHLREYECVCGFWHHAQLGSIEQYDIEDWHPDFPEVEPTIDRTTLDECLMLKQEARSLATAAVVLAQLLDEAA